ncbi:MAG: hypothetical protein JW874_05810 [Spirochaetales bacterium]|nr:hypothetical protein [Spirochaetales bacterium]
MKKMILLFLAAAPLFSSCAQFKGVDVNSPVSGTIPEVFVIESDITGISYPVHVYLPPGYDGSTDKYPVIYSTDGQWVFPGQVRILEQLKIRAILVSVEEGPKDRRLIDYMYPGAMLYFRFQTRELAPKIEHMYRIEPTDRTLVGVSAGGAFVGHALVIDQNDPPFFRNYFIFDGKHFCSYDGEWTALTQDSYYYTQFFKQRFEKNKILDINVVITYAYAPEGNERLSKWYYWELDNIGFEKLGLLIKGFKVKHVDVDPPSFWYALREVFKN